MRTIQPNPDCVQQNRRNLDPWALAALEGDHDYRTHYAAACAVASHARARGWSQIQLWDKFEGLARLQAKQDHRAPNDRKINRFISNAWKLSRQPSDPFTARKGINAAREYAARARFTGRQHSLALVLEAVLDYATQQKTITPTVSVRSLELDTGLGKSTAARALQRLVALDYLQPVTKSNGEHASTYRLRHTDMALSGTHKVLPGGTKGVSHLGLSTELARTDAFRALGRAAARVFAALDQLEALTPRELAQSTGLAPKTARAALRELEAVGLVQRHKARRGYGWTCRPELATPENLQRIALDYGTYGTQERRENTIKEQRRYWGVWQAARKTARQQQQAQRTNYLQTRKAAA